jgi:hypothetical protein
MKRRTRGNRVSLIGGRCPACNVGVLTEDGDGPFCAHCLYTPSPRITMEAAVAKEEAIAVAESRALRDDHNPHSPRFPRKRAA